MSLFRPIKVYGKSLFDGFFSSFLIKKYLSATPKNQRRVIFGGHWSNNPGWLILNQHQQDITKKLKFPSSSVNTIFLEHVFEHVELDKAVFFLKEAKRILIKNGQIRIISPSIEKILKSDLNKDSQNYRAYIDNILINLHYRKTDKLLKSIGLKEGIREDVNTFFLNSLLGESEHKFICSAMLLKKILTSLRFRKAEIFDPGKGFVKEYCLERHQRGIYLGSDRKKDKKKPYFDLESLAVDAVK